MKTSLAQRILNSGKPFTFFHTWSVTKDLLEKAINEEKSIDLDVCVDDEGNPYLGHSEEYHEKSGEQFFKTMPLWEAVDMIGKSDIVVIVDCKHYDAWSVVEEVVGKIGPEKCLVHSFVDELKFDYSRGREEPDYLTEWSPINKLVLLKDKFPNVTTTVSAKWLPTDLLTNKKYDAFLLKIRRLLVKNHVDTICLNVHDETMSDKWLRFFLEKNIIPHVVVDNMATSKLTELYIGETDFLEKVSKILR